MLTDFQNFCSVGKRMKLATKPIRHRCRSCHQSCPSTLDLAGACCNKLCIDDETESYRGHVASVTASLITFFSLMSNMRTLPTFVPSSNCNMHTHSHPVNYLQFTLQRAELSTGYTLPSSCVFTIAKFSQI